MVKNIDGWVHAHSRMPRCDRSDIIPKVQSARARWPHIEKDPQAIEHLTDIVRRLNTPMGENTRQALLCCLSELHTRLLSEQNIGSQTQPSITNQL